MARTPDFPPPLEWTLINSNKATLFVKIMGVINIDLALDPIYWQRYDELVASGICASDDQQHLQTRKSNLERALTEYAAYKMAPTPSGKKQINRDSF